MSKESMFWALPLLVAVFCVLIGLFASRDKRRAATVSALLALAIAIEAVNSYLSVQASWANDSLRHAGYGSVQLYRMVPTLPFHVTFAVLLVLAALVAPALFGKPRPAREVLNA